MARISDQSKYAIDQALDMSEYMIGTNSDGKTRTYRWRDVWAAFSQAGPQVTMRYSDVETPGLYDYHGGYKYNGDWMVIRYTRADIGQRLVATELTTPAYTDIHTAWANKETLVYQ